VSRILIAGIGNIFMGDDGFGCEVAQRLSCRELRAGVDVVDFGIRAMDLSYTLTEGYDFAILIDSVKRGGAPGTVYVIEPDLSDSHSGSEPGEHPVAAHDMDLDSILCFVASLGERGPHVLLVGCEPECLGGDFGHIGLSATVSAAIDRAAAEVQALLKELPRGRLLRLSKVACGAFDPLTKGVTFARSSRRTERQTIVGPESGAATPLPEVST
jgi:hydrogenase maturation protease